MNDFFLVIGAIFILIGGFGSATKALSDPEVNKLKIFLGIYVIRYPKYLAFLLVGGIFVLLATTL